MNTDILFGSIAGLMHVIAFGIYNIQMIEGTSQPNTATWTLWAFLTVLNFTSYLAMSKDWVKSILPTMSSIACISTFLFALYAGKLSTIGEYEMTALFLGILAGVIWWWYQSATYAQMIMQVAILISFIPLNYETLQSLDKRGMPNTPSNL